jgi:hypothetical protein
MISDIIRQRMEMGFASLGDPDREQIRAVIESSGPDWTVFEASPIVGYYSVKLLDQLAGTVDDLGDVSDSAELQSSGARHYLLQEDLRRFGLYSFKERSMDLWWYFPEMSIQREGELVSIECGTFINFREKRMYTYSSPEIAIVWEDPYNKQTWRTLSTIEEIEEYRNNEVDWWSNW